ncbi:MAG: UPF0182 family protein, partial [Synechococcaceae bacterium WB9_2_170]|nr:UPF0182 family protein [Synechococcaceae bacterium WB9_2_170]
MRSFPRFRPAPRSLLMALAAFLLLALLLLPRLWVEQAWFDQFQLRAMLLRRWGLQLLAFLAVLGLLRQGTQTKGPALGKPGRKPLLALEGWPLALALALQLALLVGGLTYLLVQARGLINEPFNDAVLSGFPVLADLPLPLLASLAVGLLLPLLRWPLTSLRITLAAALVGSATALARGWSLWLPALLAAPFGQGDPVTGLDLSFTVLRLPALRLVLSVLMAQGLVGLAGCLWLSFSQGSSLSDWRFSGLSRAQQKTLQPQL